MKIFLNAQKIGDSLTMTPNWRTQLWICWQTLLISWMITTNIKQLI